ETPRLFDANEPMQLGQSRLLSEGDDVTVITAGITTEEALRATVALQAQGVGITHVHVSTHKPFGDPILDDAIRRTRHGVITMENHLITGGLGSAVAEYIATAGIGTQLVRLGLCDTYAHGASKAYLMKYYRLDAVALTQAVEQLLDRSFGISEQDLEAVRLDAVHSAAKAEAL
ncbi:MAG: transketolase, partial [bacterium]|nr:transketolase [bacterium]